MPNEINSKAPETKNPSYTVWENMPFIIGNLWIWDKQLLLLCNFRIPALVLLPLSAIYLPKLVIDELTAKASPERLIAVIGVFTLIIVILNVLDRYMDANIKWRATSYRFKYIDMVNKKRWIPIMRILIIRKGRQNFKKPLTF